MQSGMADLIAHQHAGLQNIRLASRGASAACEFGCLVTIAPELFGPLQSGLGIEPVDMRVPPVLSYPLSVQFSLGGRGAVKVTVCYDERLVEGRRVEGMVALFGRVVGQLFGGEKRTVGEIEVGVDVDLGVAAVDVETRGLRNARDEVEGLLEDIPSRELSKSGGSCSGVALAVGDLEQEMKTLWADVLRVPPEEIAATDDFFQLGGDSISSMLLVNAANRKQIKITVADIFQNPTFAELTEFAAAQSNTATQQEAVVAEAEFRDQYDSFGVIDHLGLEREEVVETVCRQTAVFPGDVEDIYPATDYQAWAISHGMMRNRGNTNYFLFSLHGDLDTFRLEQACRKMIASNPILRTIFTTIGGQVMQVVLRGSYQIEFLRYGSEHYADDNFINWLVEQDTQRSAHLAQPIVRFKLVLHADGHYVLIMRMSHAQYDGMSMPLLIQDLEKAYNGTEPKQRPSFGKFIQGAAFREEQAVSFWGSLLDGSSMTEIVEHSGPTHTHSVDTIRTRTLAPIPANVAGMSQATLLKAAWALVLAKMSGGRDIVFGNLIFGRNMPVSGIEDIAAPCINIVPVRVKVDPMVSILDLLVSVQEQQVAAMPHENLGFRRLIKSCTDWPHWTRFSSVVQHQQLGRGGAEEGQEFKLADNLRCEMGVLGPAYDSADLWVQTTPHADSFDVEIRSCSAVVPPAVAEMLLDRLCATLSIFSAVSAGSSPQLWELLARDGTPLIPIKSSIVDDVWRKVLPEAENIAWNTPYFAIWGDEIAPVRFLEEYAEHGLHLDMEDIMENPTKQAQMMLTSRIQAEQHRSRSRSHSPRSTPSLGPRPRIPPAYDSAPQSATTITTNSRGFWTLDSSSSSSSKPSSRGSSVLGSRTPPQMGVATHVLPPWRKKGMPFSGGLSRKAATPYTYSSSGTPTSGYSSPGGAQHHYFPEQYQGQGVAVVQGRW
jgi:aryl carrier-like protein